MHVHENSSENQNVALNDWKFTILNRLLYTNYLFRSRCKYDMILKASLFCEIIFLLWNCLQTPKTAYTCSGNQPVVYA